MWGLQLDKFKTMTNKYLASYKKVKPVREKIGFANMINHSWLTTDRKVQRVDYASGYSVVVNFGEKDFAMDTGDIVKARSHLLIEP